MATETHKDSWSDVTGAYTLRQGWTREAGERSLTAH